MTTKTTGAKGKKAKPASTKVSNYVSNPFIVIFDGFSNLFKYNQTMAIILLVLGVVGAFMQVGNPFPALGGSSAPVEPAADTAGSMPPEVVAIIVGIIIVAVLVFTPIIIFITTMYNGLSAYVAVMTAKQKTVSFEEAFKAVLKKFWTILWIEVVVFLKVIGGLLLLIIPGIRAMLRYDLVLMPIFESEANAKQAIHASKALTKDHLIEIFGMSFASGLIPFVGPILHTGGQSVMFTQLQALKSSGVKKPAVHWLNYLGFLIIGLLALSMLFIALLVTVLI